MRCACCRNATFPAPALSLQAFILLQNCRKARSGRARPRCRRPCDHPIDSPRESGFRSPPRPCPARSGRTNGWKAHGERPRERCRAESVAEWKGFEPSRRSLAYSLSRGAPSTTRPPLRRRGYAQTARCSTGQRIDGRTPQPSPLNGIDRLTASGERSAAAPAGPRPCAGPRPRRGRRSPPICRPGSRRCAKKPDAFRPSGRRP